MKKEKIICYIWGCVTIVFVSFYIVNLLSNTMVVWKTTNGTTVNFDGAGLTELVLICACYYITKLLICNQKEEPKK